jgi:hypothetical protein
MGPDARWADGTDSTGQPLRLVTLVHRVLVSATPTAAPTATWLPLVRVGPLGLPLLAAVLIIAPVFLQAPWVRQAPMGAALFSVVLLLLAVRRGGEVGALLVGFSGSWLAGCLFWGWLRLHPLVHLPVEAFALPMAVAGLGGPWRRAGQFYLGSLAGTAATDAAIALCGLMPLWPAVLAAGPGEAAPLLAQAAARVLEPAHLFTVAVIASAMLGAASLLWRQGPGGRLVAACLLSTLAIDGLFLLLALVLPTASGLV